MKNYVVAVAPIKSADRTVDYDQYGYLELKADSAAEAKEKALEEIQYEVAILGVYEEGKG